MADFAPVTIRAVDNTSHELFKYFVPFTFEATAKELLERAFILSQTPANPDPFTYTLEYFGYSESQQFPGYLGYELESVNGLPNDTKFYWELMINGVSSSTGADTTYPSPGSEVLWK